MSALPGDVMSRGRLPVDSAALLDAIHSADAGATYSPLGSTPWLYLDLDALAIRRTFDTRDTGSFGLAVDEQRDRLFASGLWGVNVIDLRDGRTLARLRTGPGPRAAQSLMLACRARALLDGRLSPSMDDVAALAQPVLRHRMALNFSARAEGVGLSEVITGLVGAVV